MNTIAVAPRPLRARRAGAAARIFALALLSVACALPAAAACLDPTVYPYTAVGDDSTDNTASLNFAFWVAADAGMPVCMPAGRYRVSNLLLLSDYPLVVVGDGTRSTVIVTTSAMGDVLPLRRSGSSVSRIGFDSAPGVTRTSGAYVEFASGCTDCNLRDFQMLRGFVGVQIDSGASVRVRDGQIRNGRPGTGSAAIVVAAGNDHYLEDITADADPGSMPEAGVRVDAVGSLNGTNLQIIHQGYDLWVRGGFSLRFVDSHFDSATRGITLQPSLGSIGRFICSGCWAGNHLGNGVVVAGGAAGVVGAVELDGLHAVGNQGNGLVITAGAAGVQLNGGFFCGNGANGIWVAGGVSYFGISSLTAGAAPGCGGNAQWGVYVAAGAGTGWRIVGCDAHGNGAGSIFNGATGPGAAGLNVP